MRQHSETSQKFCWHLYENESMYIKPLQCRNHTKYVNKCEINMVGRWVSKCVHKNFLETDDCYNWGKGVVWIEVIIEKI